MQFHDMTLAAGSIRSRRQHDTSTLEYSAVEVFRELLERHGDNFRVPIPVELYRYIDLSWTQEPGANCAVATFWIGKAPVTSSILLTGRNAGEEASALTAFQQMIAQIFHGAGHELGCDVLSVEERPVILSVILPGAAVMASLHDVAVIAGMETCLAAAFFTSV